MDRQRQHRNLIRLMAILAVLSLFGAACGSSDDSGETAAASGSDSVDDEAAGGDGDDSGGEETSSTAATEGTESGAMESDAESASDDGDDSSGDDGSSDDGGDASDGGSGEFEAELDADEAMAGDDAMSEDGAMSETLAVEEAAIEDAEAPPADPVEPIPEPRPDPAPRPQSGLLTAGEIDDNLNFDFFANYLDRTADNSGQQLPRVDLRDGFTVNVVDQNRVGVANTAVTITDGGTDFQVFTNSAGTARVFPAFFGITQWESLEVQAGGQQTTVSRQQIGNEIEVVAGNETGGAPQALDVALVLDVTGSMSDELRYLTVEFESIVQRVRDTYPEADLRFSLVAYRDEGDDFVTRAFDFTGDVNQMRDQLAAQQASGGGDFPEAMDAALLDANGFDWREGNVGRLIILNADAPPHANKIAATLAESRRAADQGVRVYTLAASGVDESAEYLMRVMAATSGGRHLFLTEDSGIGGSKLEPKTECYQVTRLDNLLMRVIKSELAGERVDAAEADIIREVGSYDQGVCVQQ